MSTCPRCPHGFHSGVCGQNCGVPGFPSTAVSCKCVEPATPVEAVTEGWPDEQQSVELACEAEGHAYFRDGADPVHGVCGFCACGSRLYTITGELIEP